MNEDIASNQKLTDDDEENLVGARTEFREEINNETYQIYLDTMFDPIIRVIQRIANWIDKFMVFRTSSLTKTQPEPNMVSTPISGGSIIPPFWLYVLLFESLILLLDFSISAIVSEYQGIRIQIIPLELFNILISFCFILLVKSYFDKLRNEIRFVLIDYVTSMGSLNELKIWLDSIRKKREPLLCGLLFSLAWAFLGPFLIYQSKGSFLGWGPLVLLILANFPIGTGGYYLWISRNFRVQAKSWDFKIYEPNPSKSLVISILSKLLAFPVTIGAFLSVLVTFAFSVTRLFSFFTLVIAVICGWYPMLSLFVRNHIALASIITRAKQKKLFELQNKITEIELEGLKSTSSIEYLQKLMDYHDRIASTPNTALSFE